MKEKIQRNNKTKQESSHQKQEEETFSVPYYKPQEEGTVKKILKWIGWGGLIVGGTGVGLVVSILHIIFVWGAGLYMVWQGIVLILQGFVLWGLVVLFIGTPIVVAITQFLFPIWLIFLILWIIWLFIRWIFF